ncbi:MAG: hypothetical protein NC300_09930 [Bacteroidales bacterium]|nr:hypothetical protein [Clostridium sp.]MCM1204451.1 hypothetical protein [Bacteroidales bacterium]
MKRLIKVGSMLIFILLLLGGTVFLPEYVVKWKDARYVNQYELYTEDNASDVLSELPLSERLKILFSAEQMQYNVLTVYDAKDWMKNDKQAIGKIKKAIQELENKGLLPKSSGYMDGKWESMFNYAELYNMYLPENPGAVLSAWRLAFNIDRYGGNGEICYTLLIDAETYRIYELTVQGEGVEDYFYQVNEASEEITGWMMRWIDRYGAYLAETGTEEYQTDMDVLMDDADFIGSITIKDIQYRWECYFGIFDITDMMEGRDSAYFHFGPVIENGAIGGAETKSKLE